MVDKFTNFFHHLPAKLLNKRALLLSLFTLNLVFFGFYATKFTINQSMTGFFSKDDPTIRLYDWFKTLFGSDEFLVIMFDGKKENGVFSHEFLKKMSQIEKRIQAARTQKDNPLNRISRVRSLLSADTMEAKKDSLISRPFLGLDLNKTLPSPTTLRKNADSHKDWQGLYYSKDGRYGAMTLLTTFNALALSEASKDPSATSDEFDFDLETEGTSRAVTIKEASRFKETPMEGYTPFINTLFQIFKEEGLTHGKDFYLAGNPRLLGFFAGVVIKEMIMFMGLAFLIIWVVMVLAFRTITAIVWPSIILFSSLLILFGLIGLSGLEMTFMVNIIIFLLLAVSIATSIHILNGYVLFLREGFSWDQAIALTYKKAAAPIVLAGMTTGIGLVSLVFVPIPAIKYFGFFSCVGVFVCVLINLLMWPIFLGIWSPKLTKASRNKGFLDKTLEQSPKFTAKHRTIIVTAFVLLASFGATGIQYLKIDSNYINMIKKGHGISEIYGTIDQHFGGTASMEVLIDTGKQDGIKNSQLLKKLDLFSKNLEQDLEIVSRVQSITEVVKETRRALHEGDKKFYKIPEKDDELSHILFNLESADSASRRLLSDDNFQILRMNILMRTAGSSTYINTKNIIKERLEKALFSLKQENPQMSYHYTGSIPLMMGMVDLIAKSQVRSFGIALGVISFIMFFIFKDAILGLLAIIPNFFPLVMVMGYAGWMGIPLDMDTLLVVPIAIGIAVDDTIHFIFNFKASLKEGLSVEDALKEAFSKVGRAMFFTTVVLSIGFSIYLLSVYKPLHNFGIMSAIAVTSALLADLFLLPTLMQKYIHPKNKVKS